MKYYSIRWDLEPNCNLSCKHCLIGKTIYPEHVSLNHGFEIINKLIKLGFKEIWFSTKEPFLNPNLLEYLEYCTLNNIKSSIITNGTLLNNTIIEKLFCLNIKYLGISLEGWDKKTNDYIRGAGQFDKVKKNLKYIDKLNKESKKKLQIVIQTNINSINYDMHEEFYNFFNQFTNYIITVGELSLLGNAMDNTEILSAPRKYYDFMINLNNYIKDKQFNSEIIFTNLNYYEIIYFNLKKVINLFPEIYSCSINIGGFSILPNGDVCRCSYLIDKQNEFSFQITNIGNILNISENELDLLYKDNNYNFDYKNNETCNNCILYSKCNYCYALQEENKISISERCKVFIKKIDQTINKVLENKIKVQIFDNIDLICHNNTYRVIKYYQGKNVEYKVTYTQFKYLLSLFKNQDSVCNLSKDELKDIIFKSLICTKE